MEHPDDTFLILAESSIGYGGRHWLAMAGPFEI